MDANVNGQAETEVQAAALWVCHQCHAWWGSQLPNQRDARFLLRMAEPNTHLFKWEDYRGWRVKAAEANLCPACGATASLPRLSLWAPPTAAPAA